MGARRFQGWVDGLEDDGSGTWRQGKVAGGDENWIETALQELMSCITFITSGVLIGMRADAIRHECARRLEKVLILLEGKGRATQDSFIVQAGEDMNSVQIHLTPRQVEVLAYRWRGLQPKEIAYKLGLKESTVRGHIRDAIDCLGVRGSEAAMHKAHQLGYFANVTSSPGQG